MSSNKIRHVQGRNEKILMIACRSCHDESLISVLMCYDFLFNFQILCPGNHLGNSCWDTFLQGRQILQRGNWFHLPSCWCFVMSFSHVGFFFLIAHINININGHIYFAFLGIDNKCSILITTLVIKQAMVVSANTRVSKVTIHPGKEGNMF